MPHVAVPLMGPNPILVLPLLLLWYVLTRMPVACAAGSVSTVWILWQQSADAAA
jgi:hypothetical protein